MMMPRKNDKILNLRNLAIDRDQALANLRKDTAETRKRLKPANLITEAKSKFARRVQKTGARAINVVRVNPGLTATVAATATLIAMRKPIAKLIANRKISEPNPIEE
ncbi:hypothetical protein [Parasphingorhabdus sp.]|jgi:hypothetical protein|uniref:hypothetical protein n=1 Tax=Parasphingorhabdus sp. TaxID=2709688 RepID=UPI003098ABBA